MKFSKADLLFEIKGTILDIIASIIWAIAISMFIVPNKIAPSGLNGVAIILNYLFGLPIGIMGLAMNVPFLIICWKAIGRGFVLRTLRVLIIYSVFVDYIFMSPTPYRGDPMLAAIFGGFLYGIASAIVFMHGSCGGGLDLVVKLVRKKHPYISTGQLVTLLNSGVMILAAVVYGNIESMLYGIVMTFTCGRAMDAVLNGADAGKSVTIVTKQPDKISECIISYLHRSATIINGVGAYQHSDTHVMLCAVRRGEFFQLKRLIREADPEAFVVVSEANLILGRGFKPIDSADS